MVLWTLKPCGTCVIFLPMVAQLGDVDAGIAAARIVDLARGFQARPAAVEPIGLVGLVTAARLEFDFQPRAPIGLHLVDFALGDDAFSRKFLAVDFERGRMRADLLVHQRLGERRLVAFVMAEAPVAEHVDHDRPLEFLPVFGRHLGGEHHRLRIVAVDVEDQRLDHLGDVGRIRRRARITRISREADLVVDDEVQRAAGAVALQVGKAEAFRHHALPGESRVAVDQQRHHHGALVRLGVVLVLLGAHLAERHRVDDLEVRWVRRQRQMHLIAVELAIGRRAEMVLHVAGAFDFVGRRRAALEFVEQRAVRLAHHLGENVQAAAVRHADADFLDAEIAAALDDLLERRDQRLGAVEAEALGAGIFDVEEFLEAFRLDQLVENGALALAREADLLVAAFDALLDPRLLRGVGNVHELDADGLAIGAAQDGDDLAHGRELEPEHLVEEDAPVHVGVGKAVRLRIELLLVLLRLEPERVELGVEMPAHAVGADQHQRMDRIARRLLHVARGEIDAGRLCLLLDLVGEAPLGLGPLAVERGDQIAARPHRPVRLLPGRALAHSWRRRRDRPSAPGRIRARRRRPRPGLSR